MAAVSIFGDTTFLDLAILAWNETTGPHDTRRFPHQQFCGLVPFPHLNSVPPTEKGVELLLSHTANSNMGSFENLSFNVTTGVQRYAGCDNGVFNRCVSSKPSGPDNEFVERK